MIVLAQHGQLFLLDLRDMTLVKEDGMARDSDSETPNINVIQFSEGGFTILALDKVMRTGTDRQGVVELLPRAREPGQRCKLHYSMAQMVQGRN